MKTEKHTTTRSGGGTATHEVADAVHEADEGVVQRAVQRGVGHLQPEVEGRVQPLGEVQAEGSRVLRVHHHRPAQGGVLVGGG